jgi:hypothetical protein
MPLSRIRTNSAIAALALRPLNSAIREHLRKT